MAVNPTKVSLSLGRQGTFHRIEDMSTQTDAPGDGETVIPDRIELARLVKSDAALKQEVASLKEANLSYETRLAALEVKQGETAA